MPHTQQIELEREIVPGAQATPGGGHGEIPVEDPPPAEHPEETPPEKGVETQARESQLAFARAIARLSAG